MESEHVVSYCEEQQVNAGNQSYIQNEDNHIPKIKGFAIVC